MAKYHGSKGLVYMNTGAGSASSFSGLTSWSLDRSTDAVEVTCFGDTNKTYVQGLPDVKGSFSGFWDDGTIDTLFNAAGSSTAVSFYLYPASTAITKYEYGTAWVSASVDCSSDSAIKVSCDFVAAGAWGHK